MHELAITQDVLKVALKHAHRDNANQVESVSLRIGELRDIVDEWMQHFFDYLSRGTIAEGAKLKIERSPIVFKCACGETFAVTLDAFREGLTRKGEVRCFHCGGTKIALDGGREFEILSIEVT